jgi:poly-beta-1,6-N-acetyl-D-glucosamine synthase
MVMEYHKFWVFGLVLVIVLWAFVLAATLRYVIMSENVLVDRDFDLSLPTLVIMSFNVMYVLLGLFIFTLYLLKIDKVKKEHNKIMELVVSGNDLCSIIIPARDEQSVIKRAVLRCLEQTYKNIEVLVIAHNSSDRTVEEAKKAADKRVKVFDLRTRAAGKSIALNYGIERSNGRYIVVIDADTVLAHDFIEKALPALLDGKYAAIQGRVLPINRDYNFITKMMALEDDLWSEPILTVRSELGKRCPLLGTGFIIRKDILTDVGMFTNSLVDDHELSFRLLRKKYRIIFLPFCKAYAEEPPSIDVMLKQRARWARGFIKCLGQRIAEPSDLVGNLLWLMPIGSFFGSIMLFLIAYASIHNVLFGYVPFTFTYLPLSVWFLLATTVICVDLLVLMKVHGRKGFKNAAYLLPFIVFSQYGLIVLYRALFVRTWATTKTIHGFMAESAPHDALPPTINQSNS